MHDPKTLYYQNKLFYNKRACVQYEDSLILFESWCPDNFSILFLGILGLYFEYRVCVIHLLELFCATVKAKLAFMLHFSKQFLPEALTLVEQY